MANYDTLELTISADVSKASRGIKTLTNNLSALQEFTKKLDFALIDQLQEHLQNIAKIDFTNVSQGLKDVVSAFKAVQSKSISKAVLGNETLNPAQVVSSAQTEIAQSTPISPETNKQLEETANAIKHIKDNVKELNKTSKETKGHLEKIAGAFKRVLFYRVVRRTLQLVAQAIKEGIQNMALFDSEFNQSMSNIKSSVSFLKDSLGSMIAPLIEMLEPFITMLVDGLAEIGNKLAEVFSAMAGKDTYTKAVKGAEDYAKSLKKVKDTTLGIDELNVIKPQDEQGGNFEQAEVEKTAMNEALGSFGGTLKEMFGDYFENFKERLSIIFDVLNTIMPSVLALIEPIHQIFMTLDDIFVYLMSVVGDVLKKVLPPILQMVGSILGFVQSVINYAKPLIQMIATTISFIFDLLQPALEIVCRFTGWIFDMLGKIYDFFTPILTILNAIYTYMGGAFINAIKDALGIGDSESDAQKQEDIKNQLFHAVGVPAFAGGGFVEDGLFFANRGELVGQFSNGQTAVANNEQIIEGIKQGVYEAMILAGGNNDKGGIQLAVYLDSVEIAKRVEQRNISRKDNNIVGAYKYGS